MTPESHAIQLDPEEQALEAGFERLSAYPDDIKAARMSLHQRAAGAYLKKDRRITLRISSSDLERLKRMAAEEGLPYQSYITSLLHKVSTGRLREFPAV
jgi:predicted DNA binding CopG/RHH family protein